MIPTPQWANRGELHWLLEMGNIQNQNIIRNLRILIQFNDNILWRNFYSTYFTQTQHCRLDKMITLRYQWSKNPLATRKRI